MEETLMKIRETTEADAEQFALLLQHIDNHSAYMLWEAEERKASAAQAGQMIKSFKEKENSTILVSEKNGVLTGYVLAAGGNASRNKHTASIVIGIHRHERGNGTGSKLLTVLESWALRQGELTVAVKNKAAEALYIKSGFVVEGRKKDALLIDGVYVDEYYMANLLNS
jgi:RimJ/RimL family protein N-acetyltransferase